MPYSDGEPVSENDNQKDPAKIPEAETPAPETSSTTEGFTKVAAGVEQILSSMPRTGKHRMVYWLIGLVITTIGAAAYPLGTALSTYADKKAERETAAMKQYADALNQQRRMQADLLTRVIAVADKATLKDPTSIFQLGLIAQMVNENGDAFGIKLVDAERTMKRMFDSLAPVAGLRRRVAETNSVLASIQRKIDRAKQGRENADARLKRLNKKLEQASTVWQRKHFQTLIDEQQHYRDHHQLEYQFYSQKADQENNLKQYFKNELETQETALMRRLQQTTILRSNMKSRTKRFRQLLTELYSKPESAQSAAKELQDLMAKLESDTESAQQTIKRLKSELASERAALDAAKQALRDTKNQLRRYRDSKEIIVCVPSLLPLFECPPKSVILNQLAKSQDKEPKTNPVRKPVTRPIRNKNAMRPEPRHVPRSVTPSKSFRRTHKRSKHNLKYLFQDTTD